MSSSIASKHPALPLTEVSSSEIPAIMRKFVSHEATSEAAILKLSWQPGRVHVRSFRPTRNLRDGEKPATDLTAFARSTKSMFCQAIIHFTIVNGIISEFGACLAKKTWLKLRAGTSQSQVLRKPLRQNLSAGMTPRKRGLAAEYCSNWGQRAIRILGFFGDEFHEENLHFRGRNFGEWLNVLTKLASNSWASFIRKTFINMK